MTRALALTPHQIYSATSGAAYQKEGSKYLQRLLSKQRPDGVVAKQFLFSHSPDKRISGCLSAIVRNFKVASFGWRTPCSQLSVQQIQQVKANRSKADSFRAGQDPGETQAPLL